MFKVVRGGHQQSNENKNQHNVRNRANYNAPGDSHLDVRASMGSCTTECHNAEIIAGLREHMKGFKDTAAEGRIPFDG